MSNAAQNIQQNPANGAAAPAETAHEPTMEELAATLFKPDPANDTSTAEGSDGAAPHHVTGAKPPDPPTDEKKPPEPGVAKRIEVATRAERRAMEARRELATTQQQIDQRAKDLDAREAKLKLLEEDPVRAFEELKLDPKAFLEKLAGEQQPDTVLAKRLAKVEEDLAKERESRTKLEEERSRTQRAHAVDSEWKAASAAFIEHVGAAAEKFPNLVAEYTDTEAVERAYAVLAEPVELPTRDGKTVTVSRAEAYRLQYGDYPDNDIIAEYLEGLAKADIEARQNSAWRKRTGDKTAAPSQGQKIGDEAEARPVRGSNPRTLTSRDASERGTAPKPWTQEAADEESERIIAEALSRKTR